MNHEKYIRPERIWLKSNTEFSEHWVQELVAEDPSILGLGDLVLRDKERIQPNAGRLDLLLQDPDTQRRYEVELQLGSTDESHIIRTIEYWDIERKRYPQYDHCAVLIAETVTSRFLNVVSLFNGTIPLIALQMQAFKVGDNITLVFTTVMNEFSRGLVDEDEDAESTPTDRNYWENKATNTTVSLADNLLSLVREIDERLELKYNKFYIGLVLEGHPFNFVKFRPRKKNILLTVKIPQSEEVEKIIEDGELETLDYNKRFGVYRIRLTEKDIKDKYEILKELAQIAYGLRKSI
jgi:predicted transport protein